MKVRELIDGMRNVDVEGTVTGVEDPREVKTKFGKTFVMNATLEDDTGKIAITFWGDDALKIKEGMKVRIENGYIKVWNGVSQLSVGKFGKLTILSEKEE